MHRRMLNWCLLKSDDVTDTIKIPAIRPRVSVTVSVSPSLSPPPAMLAGYYSGARTDNAVMASAASKAWAAGNHYGEWSMSHGVAGAAAAAAAGGGAPAAPGTWIALYGSFDIGRGLGPFLNNNPRISQ